LTDLSDAILECDTDENDDIDSKNATQNDFKPGNSLDRDLESKLADDEVSSGSDSDGIVLNFDKKGRRKLSKKNVCDKSIVISTPQPSSACVSFRPLFKVPTVATDQEVEAVEESRKKKSKLERAISPRRARAMRRRLYLDLYKEASKHMLI
jgi:hypothetical protein